MSMKNIGSQGIQSVGGWRARRRNISAAAMSMKNIGSRKAFNQWAEMASEAAEAKAKLSAAAMSMRNIGSARHSISGRR